MSENETKPEQPEEVVQPVDPIYAAYLRMLDSAIREVVFPYAGTPASQINTAALQGRIAFYAQKYPGARAVLTTLDVVPDIDTQRALIKSSNVATLEMLDELEQVHQTPLALPYLV